jgi:type III pantothenate kinase
MTRAPSARAAALLVDIGNTRIKWARFDGQRLTRQEAATHSGWTADDFARRTIGSALGLSRILVTSVAGDPATSALSAGARLAGAPTPELVQTTRKAGGITVGYLEPWRLGVDRFVAAIGAHHLFPGKALCVVGVGTAMTVDLISPAGHHLGGAIIPAPGLMVESLLQNTSGIRRRAAGGALGGKGLFGRSTRAGIIQGSRYAAAATIERALEEARKRVKQVPIAVLTGGGAQEVRPLVRSPSKLVADLVLRGLAVLASEAPIGARGRRSDLQ